MIMAYIILISNFITSMALRQFSQGSFDINTDLQCGICYLPFNHTSQLPLQVCTNGHIVCSSCIRPVRKNKRCPYCRLPLLVEQLRINHKILDKLPPQSPEANARNPAQAQEFFELSPQPSVDSELDAARDGFYVEAEQNWDRDRRIMIEDVSRRRFLIFLSTLCFVVPVFFLDGYFGFFYYSQPRCTDNSYLFGAVNLRTWLVVIAFTQGLYLTLLLLSQIKRKFFGNTYQQFTLNALEQIYSMGIIFKALACAIIETVFFFGVVINSCVGPLYAYQLTLTCIHIVKLTAILTITVKQCCC